jgi:hypothetical protein
MVSEENGLRGGWFEERVVCGEDGLRRGWFEERMG